MNKFTKSSKSFFFKVLLLSILYTGIPSVSNAVSLQFMVDVELAANAITGGCRTIVSNPPNPIAFEHDCDLVVTNLVGTSIHLLDTDDIDQPAVPIPNVNSVNFTSILEEENRSPAVNNRYCAVLRNVEVRNSAGETLAQSQSGLSRCRVKPGLTVSN